MTGRGPIEHYQFMSTRQIYLRIKDEFLLSAFRSRAEALRYICPEEFGQFRAGGGFCLIRMNPDVSRLPLSVVGFATCDPQAEQQVTIM